MPQPEENAHAAVVRCRGPLVQPVGHLEQNAIRNMDMLSGTGSGVTPGNKSLWEQRRLVTLAHSGTIFWDAWTVTHSSSPGGLIYWQLRSYDRRQERYSVGYAVASCFNSMRVPITTPSVASAQECGVQVTGLKRVTGHRPQATGLRPQASGRHPLSQPRAAAAR